MRGNSLFSNGDLSTYLYQRRTGIIGIVDSIPEGQFIGSNDEEILQHLIAKTHLEPPVLLDDEKELHSGEIDIPANPLQASRGIRTVKGVRVTVSVPFTGDPKLLELSPSSGTIPPPSGNLKPFRTGGRGSLELVFEVGTDADPERLKRGIADAIGAIKRYTVTIRSDLQAEEPQFAHAIRCAVKSRRERISRHSALVKALDIPLANNPAAPSVIPVPIQRREIPPLRTAKPAAPEFGISDAQYEHILSIIRHEGRTFETAPATFAKHGEEELRDIVRAHLNGHFKGLATGEAFRAKGKTDLCIEFENRAAFVAECKNWGGEQVALDALTQLIECYLTWRDCKAALILFNLTVGGFSGIQAKVPDILKKHPQFVRAMTSAEAGEWRIVVKRTDDPDRLITVHVFLFNLFVGK